MVTVKGMVVMVNYLLWELAGASINFNPFNRNYGLGYREGTGIGVEVNGCAR